MYYHKPEDWTWNTRRRKARRRLTAMGVLVALAAGLTTYIATLIVAP